MTSSWSDPWYYLGKNQWTALLQKWEELAKYILFLSIHIPSKPRYSNILSWSNTISTYGSDVVKLSVNLELSLVRESVISIVDGSFTTRPWPCRRSTANGLKSITRNLYFLGIYQMSIVSSAVNASKTRFPPTEMLRRLWVGVWNARAFKGPHFIHGIASSIPSNKLRSKKILVEMMKMRLGENVTTDNIWCSGSEVHIACWAVRGCHLCAVSSIEYMHCILVGDTGNKKHASNCGAWDVSSIK